MATKKKKKRASRPKSSDAALIELRTFGLGYPESHLKSPWPGHGDLAVRDKTFTYLSVEGEPFSISCKLPESGEEALLLPGTQPTGYGLGRAGWVTMDFAEGAAVPVEMLEQWIDESYRAQAPKRLVKALDASSADKAPAKKAPAKKAPAKKAPAKKASAKKSGR